MRNRFAFIRPILLYMGDLFYVLGVLLLAPVIVQMIYWGAGRAEVSVLCYLVPSALAVLVGRLMRIHGEDVGVDGKGAMLVCGLAWLLLSAVAAIPFCLAIGAGYLDAYFETVSGFTTTGITMFTGLDAMPRSIIFWRAFIQWLGGLGILTFFLMVVGGSGASHRLFSAESHKIFSRRPAPGLFNTLRILWGIYTLYTIIIAVLLVIAGTSVFDGIAHSFTCLSTGGFSPYDASIAHYREAGYDYYIAIEYILTFGMILGGMNFFVHFRALSGDGASLWDNMEVRLWWAILAGGTALVMLDHWLSFGLSDFESAFRTSIFQVAAIATTTGFGTENIGGAYFPAVAKLIFLVLMVIGGCVGSTGGGIKVMRIGVLIKMVKRQIQRVTTGRRTINLLLIDGDTIGNEEIRRIGALFAAWAFFLAVGAVVTALLSSELGPLESASGMFSAMGNIGPCYISVEGMTQLHPLTKIVYIIGMLAGRLEILPILMLFSRRTWR